MSGNCIMMKKGKYWNKIFPSVIKLYLGYYSYFSQCKVFYRAGSLLNAYVMVYLKEKAEKYLFVRCVVSTICGEGLDAIIFITIAFIGTMPIEALIVMILSQAMFKTVYEIIIYPVTKTIINSIKKLPENWIS